MQRILFLFYLSISLILAQNKDEIYETLSSQIKSAKLDAIKKTLEKGIDFTYAPEGKSSLLTVAVYAKQYEIVKLFIANGADLNSMEGGFQGTAIMYAAYNNDIKMVDLLLSLGADINQRDGSYGDPAINWAAYAGLREMVNHLLKKGASPYFVGHGNALEIAMRRGSEEMVHDLADYMKVSIKLEDKQLELYNAIISQKKESVLKALKQSANPNGLGKYNRPLIHNAARLGDLEIVKVLHQYGADIERVDRIGFSTLFYAALYKHDDIVQYLLDNGADPNRKANDRALNLTPVHLAAIAPSTESIRRLVDHGGNLNVVGSTGTTPLLWALFEGTEDHLKTAIQMIELGADPTIVNKSDYTAVKYAESVKNEQLTQAIQSWQSKH